MSSFRALGLLMGLVALTGCAALPSIADTSFATSRATALHWSLSSEEGVFLGSATAIGPGQLLTNRHVVATAGGRAMVASQGVRRLPVLGVREGQDADVALLNVASSDAPIAILRDTTPEAGEALAVAGAQRGQARVTQGEALAGAATYGPGLRLARLPVAPGFSGGPVVDTQGRLVGIVMAGAAENLAAARRLSAAGPGDPLAPALVLLVDPSAIRAAFVGVVFRP